MKRIAIIAALPGELKSLVKEWRQQSGNGVRIWRWRFDESEWIAACAGAGAAAATRALTEIEKIGTISQVISVGWAGALNDEIATGRAYRVSGVIDARTGERFRTAAASADEHLLVTAPAVVGKEEKQRLAATYQASFVDMEAAAVARLAQMRGITFFCIKGISDGYRDNLPDFNRFIRADGHFLLTRFVFFALLHPQYWLALRRMGENSRKAACGIAELLPDLLSERGHVKERNGYPDNR